MQNAHLRMGRLEFSTAPGRNSTGIHIKLPMDRVIVEPAGDREASARCHMFSVVGGDQDVAAVAAAVSEAARFTTEGADVARIVVTVGENARAFRSSVTIPGRKHAVRHLVAVSEELSLTQAGASPDAQRTILCDDDTRFILYRLGVRFGLPVLPEWSEWVVTELQRRRALTPSDRVGLPSCPRECHKGIAAESCEYRPEARSADHFGQRLHGAVEFAWPVSGCRIRDSTSRH